MKFKYFDDPELFTGLRDANTICDLCKQNKPCFNAEAFYGSDELASVCPECLAIGKLISLDAFTCEGDVENLLEQLKNPDLGLTEDEIEEVAAHKTTELEKTTPHLITWQDWAWPCAEGDYCKFIGYGSKPFYKILAKDKPVEEFFKTSFYDAQSYNDNLWTDMLPGNLIKDYKDSSQYGILFYVFQSLNSEKIITIWDCD